MIWLNPQNFVIPIQDYIYASNSLKRHSRAMAIQLNIPCLNTVSIKHLSIGIFHLTLG